MTDDEIKSVVSNIENLLIAISVRMESLEEILQEFLIGLDSKDFTSSKVAKWQKTLRVKKK